MGTRALAVAALVVAAAAAAAAEPLKPQWSRPVGGKTRFVGVEEYGRCSVFIDNGAIQVVSPSGEVAWAWRYSSISRYINPREVAVSHACDAVAFGGDASYKYVWVIDRGGRSASIKCAATPADVEFDRTGKFVAVGTYAGSLHLYSINGELQWERDTRAAIVSDLDFTDDNRHIVFKGWGGAGVVSWEGHIEWSRLSNRLTASRDLSTFIFGSEPNHGPGLPSITVTDTNRKDLWHRWGSIDAFVSADGSRVLALIDRDQNKQEADLFGGGPQAGAEVQLLSRDAQLLQAYPDYRVPVWLSDDGTRAWLSGADTVECVTDHAEVLATINAVPRSRQVFVSRDLAVVFVVTEKDLTPISVERYEIPAPCRK